VAADEVHLSASLKKLCDTSATDISTLYAVQDLLGEGRFSKVYSVVDEATGQVLALKELDMGAIEEDEEGLEMLEAEVLALKRAGNAPHIILLHKVVASPDAIYLAMDRVPGRTLVDVVDEHGALKSSYVRHLMQQLLTALTALAEVGVVHRDVKPENIMVSEDETERPHLTLIDFGYAALLGEAADGSGGPMELTGVAGSPEYAAPEVLSWIEAEADATGEVEGEPYDAGCDVWSVGVTAHVLLCAAMPFELPEEATEAALVAAARNVDLSFHSRPELEGDAMAPTRDFVRACMTVARRERPSAEQLLGHPWILGSNLGTNLGPTSLPGFSNGEIDRTVTTPTPTQGVLACIAPQPIEAIAAQQTVVAVAT
jgi:serine/threonine protein kinase